MLLLLGSLLVFSSATQTLDDAVDQWKRKNLGFLAPIEVMYCKNGTLPIVDSTGSYITVQAFILSLKKLQLSIFEKGACTIDFLDLVKGQPTKIKLFWTVATDLENKIYCKYTECTSTLENIAMSLTKKLAPYNPEDEVFKKKVRKLRHDLFKAMKLVDKMGRSEADIEEKTLEQIMKLKKATTKDERLLGTVEAKPPKVQKLSLLANIWLFESKISNPVRAFIQTACMFLSAALCLFMIFIVADTVIRRKNTLRAQE